GLSNISTSGYTTLRLHVDGGQPSGDNYVQFAAYEDGTAPKPQLVLNWSTSSTPSALVNTGLPVVSGVAQVGPTLSVSSGSWSGSSRLSFAYQWQRCASPSSCVNVGGNQATYVLSAADLGSTLQVVVTASNSAGSASATSAATAVVAAQATSGTLVVPVAVGADDGNVDLVGPQSGGYPPTGTPSVAASGKTLTGGRRLAFGNYGVHVPLVRFDTSGLPAGASVTSASLKLWVNATANGDGRGVVGEWVPGAVWPLSSADWALNSSANAFASVPIASITPGAVKSFDLMGLSS